MKILTDLHHSDLYRSFKLLFEDRLGHKVYRPIGLEWFEQGYWDIAKPYNNSLDTVRQFLEPGNVPSDGTPPLNDELSDAITFEQFKEMNIDIIIASLPDHWETYTKMRDAHKPEAKVICHMGNRWENASFQYVRNLMASVRSFRAPVENMIFYHQEFDLDIFSRQPYSESKLITSFLNAPMNYETYKLWKALPELMSDWDFEEYGATAKDGTLDHKGIATSMADSRFIWQVKPGGDGFGHIIHNAMAIGRVPIVRDQDYRWTLAGECLIPNHTCIFIDEMTPEKIAEKLIQSYDKAPEMGNRLADVFYSRVNFDVIAKRVEHFIENLV